MASILLYFNASAGTFNLHNEKLTDLIQDYGHTVEGAFPINDDIRLVNTIPNDLIVIAGGDGSIKRICLLMLKNAIVFNRKIAILPFGTANNIALTLGIDSKEPLEKLCERLDSRKVQLFDIGMLKLGNSKEYFVESFGFGLFPELIKTMEKLKKKKNIQPESEIHIAISKLYKSMYNKKGISFSITADGKKYDGTYILVEIMNIKSLGPRWEIAPNAAVSDGYLDLVLIKDSDQETLITYMKEKKKNRNTPFPFKSIKARKIEISSSSKSLSYHLDDTLHTISKPLHCKIESIEQIFKFVV